MVKIEAAAGFGYSLAFDGNGGENQMVVHYSTGYDRTRLIVVEMSVCGGGKVLLDSNFKSSNFSCHVRCLLDTWVRQGIQPTEAELGEEIRKIDRICKELERCTEAGEEFQPFNFSRSV